MRSEGFYVNENPLTPAGIEQATFRFVTQGLNHCATAVPNIMKGTEYLQTTVVLNEQYNVMVNSEELIGSTEYLTLYTRRRINRCRYNRVRTYSAI